MGARRQAVPAGRGLQNGKKAFSLSDVWYGMNIADAHLPVHPGGARHRAVWQRDCTGGVLYAPAREEILQASRYAGNAELEAQRAKKHRRSGSCWGDAAVLEAMEHGEDKQYLPVKVRDNGESLARGGTARGAAAAYRTAPAGHSRQREGGSIEASALFQEQDGERLPVL